MSYFEEMKHHLFEPKWPKSYFYERRAEEEAAQEEREREEAVRVAALARVDEAREAAERAAAEREAAEIAALDAACAEIGLALNEAERAGGAGEPAGGALCAAEALAVEPVGGEVAGLEPLEPLGPLAVAPAEAGADPDSRHCGARCLDGETGDGPLPAQGRRGVLDGEGARAGALDGADAGDEPALGHERAGALAASAGSAWAVPGPAAERGRERGAEGGPAYPTGFGRGWIPAGRDIGMPGEALGWSEGESGGRSRGEISERPQPAIRHDGWTRDRRAAFLDALAQDGNVRAACSVVQLSPEAAYRLRRRDAAFAAAWDRALVEALAHTQQVLADRAIHGIEETIIREGVVVGTRHRFDTRLLLAHLGRLDRLAEAGPLAAGRDGRFDELLALGAGVTYPDDMIDEGERGRPGDPVLPLPRERYVAIATDRAGQEGREAALAAILADMGPAGEGPAGGRFADEAALSRDQRVALDVAEEAAARRGWEAAHAAYDAWLDAAEACADRAAGDTEGEGEGALPLEVKSLDGLGPDPLSPGAVAAGSADGEGATTPRRGARIALTTTRAADGPPLPRGEDLAAVRVNPGTPCTWSTSPRGASPAAGAGADRGGLSGKPQDTVHSVNFAAAGAPSQRLGMGMGIGMGIGRAHGA